MYSLRGGECHRIRIHPGGRARENSVRPVSLLQYKESGAACFLDLASLVIFSALAGRHGRAYAVAAD
jgi:hypothetical protein